MPGRAVCGDAGEAGLEEVAFGELLLQQALG